MNTLIIPQQDLGEIEKYYGEITEAYKNAFAGQPWFEKTKCADPDKRCEGGFSSLEVGAMCTVCGLCVKEPAYDEAQLEERFRQLTDNRPTAWWLEFRDRKLAMAAFAWVATPEQIAVEKYPDVEGMKTWLCSRFGKAKPIIWLDEVFANKDVKPKGNLQNFSPMNRCFNETFGLDTTAYRTITPQMIAAARKLGNQATILSARSQIPDRRDFIIIKQEDS